MKTRKELLRKLVSLNARIPQAPPCAKGCNKCCGPVFLAPIEADILGLSECITPFDPVTLKCNFLIDGKCSVYDKRPFTCRMFNTPSCGPLACFYTANGSMTLAESDDLYTEYMREICAGDERGEKMMLAAMDKYTNVALDHDKQNGWLHHDPRTGQQCDNYCGD